MFLLLLSITPAEVSWNLPPDLAVVSVKPTRAVSIPKGVRIVAEWPAPARVGSQSVQLAYGRQRLFAFVEIRELVDVPVAARALKKGSRLSLEDVRIERRPAEKMVPIEAMIGRRIRKNLRAGAALTDKDVELAPPFARGTKVTVVATRGSVRVTTEGRLYRACRIGEPSLVTVATTRAPLAGKMIDERTFVLE